MNRSSHDGGPVGGLLMGRSARLSALLLLAFGFCAGAQTLPTERPPGPRLLEGELLVKFKGGPRGLSAARVVRGFGHRTERHFDQVGWQKVKVPLGQDVIELAARYREHPEVIAAEPSYVLRLMLSETNTPIPGDPRFDAQWGLRAIQATNAWALTTGSSNVVVAVLDTGVSYTHEDMAPNMWRNPGEIEGNGIDDDSNGYIDDVHGIDAVDGDSDPRDQAIGFTYHGTSCASIIGATGGNGLGMVGVNWSVRVMALRLAAPSNFIASSWAVECFDYVLAMKGRGVNVRVTSNSYGIDDSPSLALRDAIEAAGEASILNVFAAGNESKDVDVDCDYPACFRLPSMINVTASDLSDNLASFANHGLTNVDLAAPGVNITVASGFSASSYNNSFTGTSAACPHVAGSAALLAAAYPFATVAQIKSALLNSVDPFPALAGMMVTGGRLNVARAIQDPVLSSAAPPFILVSPSDQTKGVGYPASFCVRATGTQPMSYLWQLGGVLVAQTTEPALTLPAVGFADAGDYTVIVSNALGTATSPRANLRVVTDPTILVQPQGARVQDGADVVLRVAGAGAFPLAYQWRQDGQEIEGATNDLMTLINAGSLTTGAYQVVASNAFGVVMSDVAEVTVLTRPHIVTQPQSRTVVEGADVALSVAVTNSATRPVGFLWLHNRFPAGSLVLEDVVAVTNLHDIQADGAGTWSAVVTNEGPSGVVSVLSGTAHVVVVRPPTDQVALVGSDAAFVVEAFGPAPIGYRWSRGGVELAGETATNLVLTDVQLGDAGEYSVEVLNALGQAASFEASLRVEVPAPLLVEPRRLPDGTFRMVILGLVDQQYAVEVSTNLADWILLETIISTNTAMPFVDEAATGGQRFYQARTAGP